eukprot:265987-Pyramimonas_sp.AAC.1
MSLETSAILSFVTKKGNANSTQWALPTVWDLVLNLAQFKRSATVAVGLAIDLSALILKKRAQFGTI